jgi:hypothetical protein
MSNPFENAPIISAYSRAEAIADGVLVDLTQPGLANLVKLAGVKYPIAMTATAFAQVWPINGTDPQDPPAVDMRGRLWDLMMVYRTKARATRGDTMFFDVRLGKRTVKFWARIGPGDTPDPVITIMLVGED